MGRWVAGVAGVSCHTPGPPYLAPHTWPSLPGPTHPALMASNSTGRMWRRHGRACHTGQGGQALTGLTNCP